jgi:hypothetical protein
MTSGTAQVRSDVISGAKAVCTVYQAIKEERCSSKVYDWEFILAVLRLMSVKTAIFAASVSKEKHFNRDLHLASEILERYMYLLFIVRQHVRRLLNNLKLY